MADETKPRTGGMLALVPDNTEQLAVDGGEAPEELHLTLVFLGDDISTWPAGQAERLRELFTASAPALDPVDARIMGHAVLNPDGGEDGDRDPCAVYLVGDTPDLEPLRTWATWAMTTGEDYASPPEQHTPFIAHITAGYGMGVNELAYTGPVRFGTLRLALAGDVLDLPLGTQEEAPVSGPEVKSVTFTPSAEVRAAAAGLDGEMATAVIEGKALAADGLVWVAAHCGEIGREWATEMLGRVEVKRAGMNMGRTAGGDRPKLDSIEALSADIDDHGNCPPEDRPTRVRKLRERAHKLGAGHHVHARIGSLEGATTDGSGVKSAQDGVEVKVMSPSPNAAKLREYWAHGKGREKWIHSPTPYRTLRLQLAKYVHSPRVLNGLVANVMKLATGIYPGQRPDGGRKSLDLFADVVPEVDEAALHAGVDDWGGEFADDDAGGSEVSGAAEDLRGVTDRFAAMKLIPDATLTRDDVQVGA